MQVHKGTHKESSEQDCEQKQGRDGGHISPGQLFNRHVGIVRVRVWSSEGTCGQSGVTKRAATHLWYASTTNKNILKCSGAYKKSLVLLYVTLPGDAQGVNV